MKKRLITMLKRSMAVLAISGFGLVAINPMVAFATTESSARIVPIEGALNSGYVVLNVAAETILLDVYSLAPVTGVKTSITPRAVSFDGPVVELVLNTPNYSFSNLAVGTTVKACVINVQANTTNCDTYVVPGVHTLPDTDKDGVTDNIDLCPGTPVGTVVDNTGCAIVVSPVDADNDGVADDGTDKCLGTPAGTVVDASGCAIVMVRPDVDVDGVPDDGPDKCLGTLPGVVVDADGCAIVVSPVDADNDGVADDGTDKCLGTPAGTVVDASGCAIVVPPAETKTVSAKLSSIADSLAKCGEGAVVTGGQFNINQYTVATPSINVTLSDGSVVNVALGKQTNGVLQYDVALSPGVLIVSATAVVPSDWTGQFVLSHYNCHTPEVPVTCPEGKVWTDANDNGKVDEGECHKAVPPVDVCPEDGHQSEGAECEPVVTPETCPEGKVWTDANDNGKVDEGECHKPVPPVVVVPPVAVVTPLVSEPVVTEVDKTNGRGMTIETAAVEAATPVAAAVGSENQLGAPLVGLVILGLIAVAWRRQSVASK